MELNKNNIKGSPSLTTRASESAETGKIERIQLINADDLVLLATYAICFPIAWVLPETWWSPFARTASVAFAPFRRGTHRKASDVIRSVLGARIPAELAGTLPRRHHALSLIEAMQHLRSYRPGGWSPRIEFIGSKHIDNALMGGKGAVLWVTDFIFSTLVTKIALHQAGYQVSHLSRPSHPLSQTEIGRRLLNPIVTRLETRHLERRVVVDDGQMTGGIRILLRRLKANGLISITVDNEARQTQKIPIFDGYIHLAPGAPRLALNADAPLLPVFTMRRDDGGFVTMIGRPIEFPRNASAETACEQAMKRYIERLESFLIEAPHLWYDWSSLITRE